MPTTDDKITAQISPAQQPTSYSDILNTIGTQLKDRQGLIAKRVAFISLPLILMTVALVYFRDLTKYLHLSDQQNAVIFFVLLFLLLFVGLPWALVMGQIFKVERILWIDSFFDNQPLASKESWKLAKKLFWPSVVLNIIVFVRYWVLAIVLSVGSMILYGVLLLQKTVTFSLPVFLALVAVVIIGLIVYTYFINVHLRYLLFLLVDNYKSQAFSYRSLFSDMKKLNRTSKTGDFTKMVVMLLGTEATANISNTVIGMLNGAVTSRLNGAGKAAGEAVSLYASEVVSVNKNYAQTVTFYLYYRAARQVLYGQAQAINNELYADVKPTSVA